MQLEKINHGPRRDNVGLLLQVVSIDLFVSFLGLSALLSDIW